MRICVIAAVAENGVIGRGGKLPWHLSSDLKRFRAITMGKPLVMGRKTFESLPGVLPGRPHIVVTRDPEFAAAGTRSAPSLEAALIAAEAQARTDGAEEIMVVGGGEVYRQALPRADRLYLTEVHDRVPGDASFPDLDRTRWREVSRQANPPEAGSGPAFSFVVLERAPAGPIA